MKRKILALLAMMTLATALVACAGEENRTSDEVATQEQTGDVQPDDTQDEEEPAQENTEDSADGEESAATDTVAILGDVWDTYGENDKFYAMGGDMNHMVENAPGLYSLEDKEALASMLLVQADTADMIDEAASLLHGMNTNVFTGAAFRLTDAANMQPFADAMKNSILNNQWMCGSPDQYVIYSVGDRHVVMAFGAVDVMKIFKEKFMAVHGDNATVIYEENVAQ